MFKSNRTDYYKYFFGDERGETFVKVFLDDNFNPRETLDATQEAVMTGRYRTDNTFSRDDRDDRDIETIQVGDNDVHPEFAYFIQQFASRMKQVDKFATEGTPLQFITYNLNDTYSKIKDRVVRAITEKLAIKKSISVSDFKELIDIIPKKNIEGLTKQEMRESVYNQLMADINSELEKIIGEWNTRCGATRPEGSTGEEDKCEAGVMFDTISKHIIYLVNNSVKVQYYDANTTLLKSDPAQLIFENVYADWNNVSDKQKRFYMVHMQLMRRDPNNPKVWKSIPDSEYQTFSVDKGNYDNYRLNLSKSRDGLKPKIYDLLRRLGDNASKTIRNIVYFDPTNKNYVSEAFTNDSLANLYDGAEQITDDRVIDRLKSPQFRINVRKLVKDVLNTVKNREFHKYEQYTGPIFDIQSQGVWFRSADGNYVKEENGKYLKYGSDDDYTRVMLTRDKCYSSLVNATPEQCRKYLYECLLDGDENNVQVCLDMRLIGNNGKNFYEVSKSEIDEMHPAMAIMTLQKFGFRTYGAYDSKASRDLIKMESSEHWKDNYMKQVFLNNFKAGEPTSLTKWGLKGGGGDMTPEQEQKWDEFINEGKHLIGYLGLISDFVNRNPGILNHEYFGLTDEYERKRVEEEKRAAVQLKGGIRTESDIGKDYQLFRRLEFAREVAQRQQEGHGRLDGVISDIMSKLPFGEYKCPPFMFHHITGEPDPVCIAATGFFLKKTIVIPTDRMGISGSNSKIIVDEMMKLLDRLNTERRLSDKEAEEEKSKILKLYESGEKAYDDLLKEYEILKHFVSLCDKFEGYDKSVIKSENIERLKKICARSYRELNDAQRDILKRGVNLEVAFELAKSK